MSIKAVIAKYPIWLAVIGFVLAYAAQLNFDTQRLYGTPRLIIDFNQFIEPQPLSSETAKIASLGAEEFLADWYWLNLIQYYGGGNPYGRYRKLPELFQVVTDLSPKFQAAYQTGLLTLPGEGFIEEGLRLGEKGKQNLPERWEMPYYTGLIYHIHKKDFARAAAEFDQAGALPGAPPSVKLFAAIYHNQANDRQTAYQLFKTIYDSTDDKFARERAAKYVGHLEILFALEDAVKTFRAQAGRYPATLNELVSRKIISEIPASPLGQQFAVDPATGAVAETKR